MTIETKPFDVAEVLNSEDRIADYLDEAFESGDPGIIASAIGDVARSRNLSTLAKSGGLTRETIYQAFSSDGNPTLSTMTAVTKSLGFRLLFEAIENGESSHGAPAEAAAPYTP